MKAEGKRLPNGAWVPAGQEDRVPMNNGRARKREDGSSFFIAFCTECDHEHEVSEPWSPKEAQARIAAGSYGLGHPLLPCAEHKKEDV